MTKEPAATTPEGPETVAPGTDTRSWEVLGRTITLPVVVRHAVQWSVQYLVDEDAAQRIVESTGLQVTGPLPHKALMALAVCRYLDTDLDPYHEVAVSFVVRPHDAPPITSATDRIREFARGAIGVYIHQLPVDQEFTCTAGRDIWGFPKFMTTIDIDEPSSARASGAAGTRGSATIVRLVDDGTHVLSMAIGTGSERLRLPSSAPPTYSYQDGVLRRTTWTIEQQRVSGRFGGTTLTLGDHPIADELRTLGLPKRALFTSACGRMSASFDGAEVVEARPAG